MTATKTTAMRCLALAQLRLTATDDQALTDARDYLVKALTEVESLRMPYADPVRDVLHELVASPAKKG